MPPPPPPRTFWSLGAQKCSCKHFPWHFSSEKSILGKCRSSLFLCQVNDHLHFKAFEIPLLTVQVKLINLIKILAWFIATNLIFSKDFFLNKFSSKKGQNEDEATASSCLILATALWWRWIVQQQQQQQQQHFISPHNIQEIKIYNNSTDDDRGAGCPK